MGFAAVHQDIYAVCCSWLGLDEMAGAGYAVFCAKVVDGYHDWRPPLSQSFQVFDFF